MTALVLVLAGVAAGDGGVRAGAATAPLTEPPGLDLSRDWEGTVYVRPDKTASVRLSRRQLTVYEPRVPPAVPFALTLLPGGRAIGVWGTIRIHGTYQTEGGRVLICVVPVEKPRPAAFSPRDGVLFTLKPAARRP